MTPAGEALIKHWSHKGNSPKERLDFLTAITSRIGTLGLRGNMLNKYASQ